MNFLRYVENIIINNNSGHPRLEPRHFVEPGIAESYGQKYMFLGCIEFISKVWD